MGRPEKQGEGFISFFSTDKSLWWSYSQPSLPGSERKRALQMDISLITVNAPYKMLMFTLFSELLSSISQNNQLKIILMLNKHILVCHILHLFTTIQNISTSFWHPFRIWKREGKKTTEKQQSARKLWTCQRVDIEGNLLIQHLGKPRHCLW